MAVFLLLFSITMIIAIWMTGGTFDTLIDKVFTGCLGEGGIMGAIQLSKVITGRKKNNDE